MSIGCYMEVLNHYIVHPKLILYYVNWNLNKNLKTKKSNDDAVVLQLLSVNTSSLQHRPSALV